MNKQIFQDICEDFPNWRDDFTIQITPDELRELRHIKNFEYLRHFIYLASCTNLKYGTELADAGKQQHLNAFKLLMQSDVFRDVYQVLQQNGKETLASVDFLPTLKGGDSYCSFPTTSVGSCC